MWVYWMYLKASLDQTLGTEPYVLSNPSACLIACGEHGMLNMKLGDLVTYELAICKQAGAASSPMRYPGGLYPIADNSYD